MEKKEDGTKSGEEEEEDEEGEGEEEDAEYYDEEEQEEVSLYTALHVLWQKEASD